MTILRRAVLLSIPLILWLTSQGLAQQPQSATLGQLQAQYRALVAIDLNPQTPPEVRNQNRSFLEMRRAELRSALVQRISDLRSYLSSTGAMLKTEERQAVELSISKLETELKDLTPGEAKEDSGVLKIDDIPLASTMKVVSPATTSRKPSTPKLTAQDQAVEGCRKDLIKSVSIVKDSTPPTLEILLNVGVSRRTQAADVTRGRGFKVPASHIEISIQEEGGTPTTITPVDFEIASPAADRITIPLTGVSLGSATSVTVTLKGIVFACPSVASPTAVPTTSATGPIETNDKFLERRKNALNEANKNLAAKTSDQKNFRMGFMAAKGDGEKAQGATDVSINKTLYGGGEKSGTVLDVFDQADVALQLKKSSAEKTDARQMVLGLNLIKTFLIGPRLSAADIDGTTARAKGKTTSEILEEKKNGGFFRTFGITEGLNLEGEAFDFKTTNFVSDTTFEFASIPYKIGSGFINLNIFGGPELGRNMSKPDAATTVGATAAQLSRVDWITRLKAGGEVTLRLLRSSTGSNWGIEFSGGFVNRTLFNSEVFTEATTDAGENKIKTVTIGKGNKAYRQANLKVFLFGNEKARYGVNLSYMNGRLPPAFAPTKGFQFGLLVESTDDTKGGEPANTNK